MRRQTTYLLQEKDVKKQMSHFIPHPLVTMEAKELTIWFQESVKNPESLLDYLKNSPTPRWAASFLVKAIAKGLVNDDLQAATLLLEVADRLSHRQVT